LIICIGEKYNRKKHIKAVQVPDSRILEITWTIIPLLLVLLMFYYGFIAFMPMRKIPKDAIIVKVHARMWKWSFEYDNGKKSDTLVVPLNKPVALEMTSQDVIHSFYVPAFRVKEDVVPGKITHMWFIAEEPGEYDVMCAEYCGLRHSYMETKVKVVSDTSYKIWFEQSSTKSAIETNPGYLIIKKNNCIACHSLDGPRLVGPSFKGLYGSVRTVFTNGVKRQCKADDDYIKESIYFPNNDVEDGFPKGVMQSYKNVISEKDINDIINFLKTVH